MSSPQFLRLIPASEGDLRGYCEPTETPLTPALPGSDQHVQSRLLHLAAKSSDVDSPAPPVALDPDGTLAQLALEVLPHGVSVFDTNDRLLLANRRCIELWQLPIELRRPGATYDEIMAATKGREVLYGGAPPGRLQRKEWLMDNGRRIGVTIRRLAKGGWVALHEDITELRQAEARIAYLDCYDELTGLPKRAELCKELDRLLTGNAADSDLAVICLDLDRFRTVIDQFGHIAADQLLGEAADRLRSCARQTDLVVRLSGDAFAVLQSCAVQPAGANALALRMMAALAKPFELDGCTANVGASAGIAVAPFDGQDAKTLLRNAELALSHAKAEVRGKSRFFEPAMDARAQALLALESDLRLAVDNQALHLHYQPKVNLDARAVCGVEALLRWRHPTRGDVSPLDFIPLAEETGLIVAIGRWVLARACADAAHWPPAVHVAVNVSVLQFRHGTLLRDVAQALDDSGLAANRLEVEITETVMMEDAPQAIGLLNELRSLGVRVAMDDFGTGFSSLSYLRSFPFDRIKIDRSFVRDVDSHTDARSIVRAIAGLGRSLGMAVTAEGVETPAQLEAVSQEGCDEVQGYLLSKPRPACDIPALIETAAAACISLGRDR